MAARYISGFEGGGGGGGGVVYILRRPDFSFSASIFFFLSLRFLYVHVRMYLVRATNFFFSSLPLSFDSDDVTSVRFAKKNRKC